MKRRRRPKRKREKKNKRPAKDGFGLWQYSYAHNEQNEMKANVLSKARECEKKFPELVDSLVGHFRDRSPPQIIAILANYGLQRMVTDAGLSEKSLIAIQQHHVELLQALTLIPQKYAIQSIAKSGEIR